ncbi:MAG: 30S ribosomal protein S17 [Bacilli bacterium]
MKDKRTHELIGKVVSDKSDKSITVLVETYKNAKIYGKRVKNSKKYAVHDEKNEAKIGDKVRIVETRPISKSKHYRLAEILEKAIII